MRRVPTPPQAGGALLPRAPSAKGAPFAHPRRGPQPRLRPRPVATRPRKNAGTLPGYHGRGLAPPVAHPRGALAPPPWPPPLQSARPRSGALQPRRKSGDPNPAQIRSPGAASWGFTPPARSHPPGIPEEKTRSRAARRLRPRRVAQTLRQAYAGEDQRSRRLVGSRRRQGRRLGRPRFSVSRAHAPARGRLRFPFGRVASSPGQEAGPFAVRVARHRESGMTQARLSDGDGRGAGLLAALLKAATTQPLADSGSPSDRLPSGSKPPKSRRLIDPVLGRPRSVGASAPRHLRPSAASCLSSVEDFALRYTLPATFRRMCSSPR
jgi:hypothetical protein